MSVTRINKFEAKDGIADSLHGFLRSIVPLIGRSQGCEPCQVLQSRDNPNRFVVIEAWASVSAHEAAVKNISSGEMNEVMHLLASPPSGSYYEP
jgi:quinol monooxygenase YgiN